MAKIKRIKYRLITLAYSLVILIINSTPGDQIPKINILHFDNFVHFSIYFGLGFLLLMAVIEQWHLGGIKSIFLSLFIGGSFGAFDEFHQYWIPKRIPSFFDFVADISGLLLGILLMFFLILYRYIKVKL